MPFASAGPDRSMNHSFASFAMPSRAEAFAVGSSLPQMVPAVCVPWYDAPEWSPNSICGSGAPFW